MSATSNFRIPQPANEPVLSYAPGSPERAALKAQLDKMAGQQVEVPLFIGGREVRTGRTKPMRMPHKHAHVLGTYHEADPEQVTKAIDAALAAKRDWENTPFHERAAIFQKAADLLATKWRPVLNAATMLGQSKTVFQAEIDSACELIDFLRFNAHFADKLLAEHPYSPPQTLNQMDYRGLDGFVFAVTPFNFTAIGGNLPTAPALMGNTVVWKPAATATYSNWHFLQVLREAGLPDGVINFIPGDATMISDTVLSHPDFGGVHFTGSTAVFNMMFRKVGESIDRYRQYPRLVGETGGKDFVLAHASAADDLEALAVALVRGAFEYQGQKCSAASRAYVPESLWPKLKERLVAMMAEIKVGDVRDFRNFMGAVIDEKAFRKCQSYIDHAKSDPKLKIVAGGECDGREGWFVRPTLVESQDPRSKLMCEEIFGPILTVYVYPDAKYAEVLREVDQGTAYALTGSIFARDRKAIALASTELRHAAGNFYINDKPTGAVVGQQPFGGSRASGTNDKAGSAWNLMRWVSPRTIKENFVPPTTWGYPFMAAE
ncbi:MAG: L-glutamate gamma-semialdehyde dehydrogenase [Myxococcaceae bacterium]|nr:L-glutamate gamma-semialdehyde dehydrogenase [Myxococcaceae bacterium]